MIFNPRIKVIGFADHWPSTIYARNDMIMNVTISMMVSAKIAFPALNLGLRSRVPCLLTPDNKRNREMLS